MKQTKKKKKAYALKYLSLTLTNEASVRQDAATRTVCAIQISF